MVRLSYFPAAVAIAFPRCTSIESKRFNPVLMRSAAFTHTFATRNSIRTCGREDTNFAQFQLDGNRDRLARGSVVCHASVIDPVIASTSVVRRVFVYGVATFMSNWKAYSVIPLIAGFVGW